MPTGNESRRDLQCQLDREPCSDERIVGDSTDGGVVTLIGEVESYNELCRVERAVERIRDLQDAISQLPVRTSLRRTDLGDTKAAPDGLHRKGSVSTDSINAKIDMLCLTLEEGDWLDKLKDRGHTFAYLSRQALDIAEGLGSDPTAAVLLRLATAFDRLAGAFGTAHEVGAAMRRRP